MKKISLKGVVVGSIVDLVATYAFGIALGTAFGIYLVASHGLASFAPDQMASEIAKLLQAKPLIYWTQFAVGSLCSVLGGFIAARIARRHELLNAGLTSICGLAIGLYGLAFQTNALPLWQQLVGFIATPASAILGGYLQLRTSAWGPRETPSAAPPGNWATALGRNAINSFRIAAFLDVPEHRMPAAWWQVPVFALAGLVFALAVSFWQVGLDGRFAWYSLPSALFPIAVLVLAGIFVGYALGRPEGVLRLVLGFFMAALAIDLVGDVVALLFSAMLHSRMKYSVGYLFGLLPSVWLAAACAVFAIRMAQRKIGRALGAVALCALTIALPLNFAYHGTTLWYPKRTAEDAFSSSMPLAQEGAFYEQAKLLDRELQALRPGRKGVVDVYFVGMAGDAQQDVFMKEVEAVSRLFQERFHATGHIVRLVNNPKAVARSPIASTTSLRMALQRVSQVMDKDEDLLFLFMTSHGSERHEFSLNFWPVTFTELNPARLRALLDESGIKDRVVVISACYSGGFIGPLKDEHTVVITAAAADRTSFGCSNEAQWTYFGKAYFDEALRHTYSFVKAFDVARPVIAEREKKQDFEGSNPQIFVGAGIEAKLARLEKALDRENSRVTH